MTPRQQQRFWLGLTAIAAALSLAAMIAVLSYRSWNGQRFREQSYQNCRSIEDVKMALRLFIADVLAPPPGHRYTTEQQENVRRIEVDLARRFPAKKCVRP